MLSGITQKRQNAILTGTQSRRSRYGLMSATKTAGLKVSLRVLGYLHGVLIRSNRASRVDFAHNLFKKQFANISPNVHHSRC